MDEAGAVRAILAGGFLLILFSLLANSAAAALIVGASILPIAILYWCRKVDVFENEPAYIVAGFGIVGAVVGALLGWLGAFTTTASWFDQGVLNFGAAGFGGRFARWPDRAVHRLDHRRGAGADRGTRHHRRLAAAGTPLCAVGQ